MTDGKLAVARLPPISGNAHRDEVVSGKFTGPTYKIQGKIHSLPPPQALKPYVDTRAGELDTWPSHCSGQAVSRTTAMVSNNKHFVLINDEELGKPQMVPKPRFLQQLEDFLKKELRALGVTEVKPSELRLQAHREVFEYLIEDFKTYRSLLSAIKNEYEMMLAHLRQQIREHEPLKQMLVTVSEQCDQKVMAIRDEEKTEMTQLKAENRALQEIISSLHNDKRDLVEQVARLKEKLSEEYKKYRDECDARKLLVSDINDLRYQQEDYLMSKHNLSDEQETQDDPVMLRIALKKAREDEIAASQRLAEMVANYGDVIPRRDFEALDAKYKQLDEKNQQFKKDLKILQSEHDALLEVQKQVTIQRDDFYVELQTLKRSSTPRPDWSMCSDYVSGGATRWEELSKDKRSRELLEIILQEFSSAGIADMGAEYFDGKGLDDSIPKYLRYEGMVRNRKLSKRDCALMIRDIWREKVAADAQSEEEERSLLQDFFADYLQQRFALETMVVEWAYNLHDALQKYSTNESINFFWKVLNGEADEEIYHALLRTISQLLNHLSKADTGDTGLLSHDAMRNLLQEYFPKASVEDIIKMVSDIDEELRIQDNQDIEYRNLFMEDDEGNLGRFLEGVKKYLTDQRMQFVDKVKDALGDNATVTPDDFKRAISMVFPAVEDSALDEYCSWVFETPVESLYDVEPAPADKILERFRWYNIQLPD